MLPPSQKVRPVPFLHGCDSILQVVDAAAVDKDGYPPPYEPPPEYFGEGQQLTAYAAQQLTGSANIII